MPLVPEREREQPPELTAPVLRAGDMFVQQPGTGSGSKKPCERSVAGDSVARANGSSSPRSQAAAGIEKPRLRPCTISRGTSGAAALRSKTFFERPRTLCLAGSANAKFVTTESRNGTRASSEWAIDARSVFTSRSSTR